jgi:hypothetical protein
MTYRFISPNPDGSAIDVAIVADDLQAGVDDFADNLWRPDMTGTFAVWCGQRLGNCPRISPGRRS